jgi:hypothetical protein
MGADVLMKKVGTAEISGKPLLVESAHERGFYREQAGKRDIRRYIFPCMPSGAGIGKRKIGGYLDSFTHLKIISN